MWQPREFFPNSQSHFLVLTSETLRLSNTLGLLLACLTAFLALLGIAMASAIAFSPAEAGELTEWIRAQDGLVLSLIFVHLVHLFGVCAVKSSGGGYNYPPLLHVYPGYVDVARRIMYATLWSAIAWALPALLERPGVPSGLTAHFVLATAVYLAIHWALRTHNVFRRSLFEELGEWMDHVHQPKPVRRKYWARGLARTCAALTGPDAAHAFAAYAELRRELFVELDARMSFALYGPDLDEAVRERLSEFLDAWQERPPASQADPAWLALQAAARRYYSALPAKTPPPPSVSASWPRRRRRQQRQGAA